MKVYKRTEDGSETIVSVTDGLAEVNTAMMEGRREVRQMSSGRYLHHIEYADGRVVSLILVDAHTPMEQGPEAWTGEPTRIVTVKGKRYVVATVVRNAGTERACVHYWSERNGQTFGATRDACESNKPGSIGRAIWDAVN